MHETFRLSRNFVAKGGFKSEDVEGFSNLQKYIPNYYRKFAFTADLVYLYVVQIGF